MDYYQPPTDHLKALEMESIQTKLDAKRDRMGELEVIDRDWTAQEEDEYRALEDDVRDLENLLDETWENRRG
jgi:hypothetical protein